MYNNNFNICMQNNICDSSRQHKQIIIHNAACATIKEIIFTSAAAAHFNSHVFQYSVNNQSSHSNSRDQ